MRSARVLARCGLLIAALAPGLAWAAAAPAPHHGLPSRAASAHSAEAKGESPALLVAGRGAAVAVVRPGAPLRRGESRAGIGPRRAGAVAGRGLAQRQRVRPRRGRPLARSASRLRRRARGPSPGAREAWARRSGARRLAGAGRAPGRGRCSPRRRTGRRGGRRRRRRRRRSRPRPHREANARRAAHLAARFDASSGRPTSGPLRPCAAGSRAGLQRSSGPAPANRWEDLVHG